MKKLGDVFKISKGKKAIEYSTDSELRYIQIGDLRNNNIMKYTVVSNSNVLCTKEDVLIAWDGANAGTVGYNLEGVIGSTLAKLTPKIEGVNSGYVGRFLQSKFNYLRENCTGATIPHLSRPILEGLKIPLPPLPQQQKIAAILDAADALRQNDKALLAKYDELTQALFLDMFGDPMNNPKGWEIVTIRDLIVEAKYGTSSKASDVGAFTYLRMNNITYNGYMDLKNLKYIDVTNDEKKKYLVKRGDVIFNRTNSKELVGKTGIISQDEEMIIAGYLIRMRTNKLANPYYIWRHLNSDWAKSTLFNMCKSIVGMANINAQELQNIKIIKAPIDLQNLFAERVILIEEQKAVAQASLLKSEELFNSLLQKAFKGELV
jgi:type I restriction enzyme S subunit